MFMDTSDESLISAAVAGDAGAFGTLVERHYDMIFRVAFRSLGNRADAEDLTQEICAALPAKLSQFSANARFTTWLYRLTVNAATDLFRRKSSHARAASTWGEVELLNRATDAETRAETIWLNTAMTTLPMDLRQTVALVLGEDMTHAQAAQVLEISEGTVSWRMSEVRKALKTLAQSEEHHP
jgi:RNA polymerase sigma-70 factor (ECF subfamily)